MVTKNSRAKLTSDGGGAVVALVSEGAGHARALVQRGVIGNDGGPRRQVHRGGHRPVEHREQVGVGDGEQLPLTEAIMGAARAGVGITFVSEWVAG
jgi:DNA-binding transcriptional LysR family regulator